MPRFFKGSFSSKLEKNRAQIRQGAFDLTVEGGHEEWQRHSLQRQTKKQKLKMKKLP